MDEIERRLERATAEIAGLRTVVAALIASAPNRDRLMRAIGEHRTLTRELQLGHAATDERIELIDRIAVGFQTVPPAL